MTGAAADLVVTGTRVVTPQGIRPAAVVIASGVIQRVEPGAGVPPDCAEHLDAGDAAVMPGIVDVHVHVNEPGRTEWEGFATATRAAAAGGVTTIVDMPLNSVPVTTTVDGLREKERAAAGQAMVDYGFWGGVVPDNRSDLAPLIAAGVLGFKCFLVPSGIPEFAHVTEQDLRPVMRLLATHRSVLLVHAELQAPVERATAALAGSDPHRYRTYLTSRPPEAELAAIELVLRLCAETACRVHIAHLSSGEAIDRIAAARSTGLPVTVETCPHYLTFGAEDIPDGATVFKCAPPIRERANRERLWAGLSQGAVDLIASDHSPAPPALKCLDSGDFFRAWGGISSLQLLLPATWTGARERGRTIAHLARWLCEGPARLAGLASHKGRIAPGYDADLVIWNPEESFVIGPKTLYHRYPLSPYQGHLLFGRVERTLLRGVPVYDRGSFAPRPMGRRLWREDP
ncbi:MAG: allantoinase AllB [Gemmatimonadetes bacterium]|nr:allantoinase AllB [Gemmatimonadota bacterium]